FVESDDLDLAGCIRDVIDEGTRIIELQVEAGTVTEAIHSLGQVPLPPYITRTLDDAELYQTVYARDEHSAAAPTAGLHFTDDLLEQIEAKGIGLETVRLDVGIDTFRPVSADDPLDHRIHTEYIQVDGHTVEAIERVKACGGRVIAVGTTTARALETAYQAARKHAAESVPTLEPYAGRSGLFIVAGYEFGIVDALITNFHVPRSSLMMMVSALAGRDLIMETYRTALEGDYRFLSFGDAMLIQ
ncbi:MAG: S-adenosylmethionine:tRNA ribosyltransferase-isomerase, partial [Coriobacteriia bacterium]|nr:S-adenosylmethionine:tRNA ribosyltransferase-isomerase [Coriobacteriia bacterium]